MRSRFDSYEGHKDPAVTSNAFSSTFLDFISIPEFSGSYIAAPKESSASNISSSPFLRFRVAIIESITDRWANVFFCLMLYVPKSWKSMRHNTATPADLLVTPLEVQKQEAARPPGSNYLSSTLYN